MRKHPSSNVLYQMNRITRVGFPECAKFAMLEMLPISKITEEVVEGNTNAKITREARLKYVIT